MHGVPPIIGSILEELEAVDPENSLRSLENMVPLQELSRLFDCMTLNVANQICAGDNEYATLLRGKARLENIRELQGLCTQLLTAKAQREQELRNGPQPEYY